MARKKHVPEDVAFRLAQKAKAAVKKAKAAEAKTKAAEKKAVAAEEKAAATDGEDDFDDFDDFDDDDDQDVDAEVAAPEGDEQEIQDSPESDDDQDVDAEVAAPEGDEQEIQDSPDSDDDELDVLLKHAEESESGETKVERADRLAEEGDFNGALEIWKELTAGNESDPANWRGLASVLESRNQEGDSAKARTTRGHADRLETQAVAEATGRKMEDIIADLLDDGVLNFSAGSDAKEQQDIAEDDDLTKLPGIGSVGQDKLISAGIETFEQLSGRSDEEIAEIIGAKRMEAWSSMAKMHSNEKK